MRFLVSLLTPFDARGRVDLARLRAHVLWLATQGVHGFVPTGSAGEFLYLSDREREAVHRTVLDAARGLPVYPCTWDPSPTTTTYLTKAAMAQGAAGVLMPPPLFYPLDNAALTQWFASMSEHAPLLACHHPGQLPSSVSEALYSALLADGRLVGMKDRSGDRWRAARVAAAHPGTLWLADDLLLPVAREIDGLAGVVSTLGNLWPSFCLRLLSGEPDFVPALRHRCAELEKAGGVRAMKSLLRMGCRTPLTEPCDEALMGLAPPEGP